MHDAEIQEMVTMEREYWWHQGKRRIIRAMLDKFFNNRGPVLDYGCGGGENLRVLSSYGDARGVDTSVAVVDWCRRQAIAGVSQIQPGEVPPGPFKLICALDVVEHIRDDVGILESFHKSLTPGGLLLVSVPAYRFLWSEHDEALHHVRRYVASEMRAKLTMVGFDVMHVTYAVTFVFPLILGYRLFRGIFPRSYEKPKVSYVIVPRWVNSFFLLLLRIEASLITRISLPFGCSLFAIARKPDAAGSMQ